MLEKTQDRIFIQVGRNCALSLLCETTGFKADDALAELTVIDNGFGEFDFWTFH